MKFVMIIAIAFFLPLHSNGQNAVLTNEEVIARLAERSEALRAQRLKLLETRKEQLVKQRPKGRKAKNTRRRNISKVNRDIKKVKSPEHFERPVIKREYLGSKHQIGYLPDLNWIVEKCNSDGLFVYFEEDYYRVGNSRGSGLPATYRAPGAGKARRKSATFCIRGLDDHCEEKSYDFNNVVVRVLPPEKYLDPITGRDAYRTVMVVYPPEIDAAIQKAVVGG